MLGFELRMQSVSMTIYCNFPDNLTNSRQSNATWIHPQVWHPSANPRSSRTFWDKVNHASPAKREAVQTSQLGNKYKYASTKRTKKSRWKSHLKSIWLRSSVSMGINKKLITLAYFPSKWQTDECEWNKNETFAIFCKTISKCGRGKKDSFKVVLMAQVNPDIWGRQVLNKS